MRKRNAIPYCSVVTIFVFLLQSCGCTHRNNSENSNAGRQGQDYDTPAGDIPEYHFDSTAYQSGCAKASLQKVSPDYRYELLVEMNTDSLPVNKELSLDSIVNFVSVTLKKYAPGNTYINDICNDAPRYIKGQQTPQVLSAVSGRIIVAKLDKDNYPYLLSVTIKAVKLADSSGVQLVLPEEKFTNVQIGWYPG